MRVRRFNREFPKGKLFTDPDELVKAEKEEEWWDAEWKVGREPALRVEKKQCECGCGQEVAEGKKFVYGHYQKWLKEKKKNGDYQNYQPSD